jgi:hypothetical protein
MKKNNISKKAQLTFFMLLGCLILIVISFVFYLGKQTASSQTKKETYLSQGTTFDTTSIKEYISACFEKTARDGMTLLGKQGGIIYSSQGGLYDLSYASGEYAVFQENGVITNVSYGLRKRTNRMYTCVDLPGTKLYCNNTVGEFTPLVDITVGSFTGNPYPWVNFPYLGSYSSCINDTCFGKVSLPTLDGDDSMYHQLEFYINNTITKCTNFSVFKGFKITQIEPTDVKVNTTNQTVIAVLRYPLIIQDVLSKRETKLDLFYYDTNIRLKYLHSLAIDLVRKDSNDPRFIITSDNPDTAHIETSVIYDNPSASTYFNSYNSEKGNIFRIKDNFSGMPFTFQFARANRAPVLGNFSSPNNIDRNFIINASYFNNMSVYDPDEETISKRYSSTHLSINNWVSSGNFQNKQASDACGGISGPTTFYITVCASDSTSSICDPSQDKSRDWQNVYFEVIC